MSGMTMMTNLFILPTWSRGNSPHADLVAPRVNIKRDHTTRLIRQHGTFHFRRSFPGMNYQTRKKASVFADMAFCIFAFLYQQFSV